MSDKERIVKEKLDYSGIFDFKGFYSFCYNWLKSEEEYDVAEEKYSEKVSGNARTIAVEWKGDKSISDYFKISIKLKFDFDNMVDVEVETDGVKKKLNKGSVKVEITGDLIIDQESKWDATPFYIFIRKVYDKYIIPSKIGDMQGKVAGLVVDLKENMKSFLEMSGRR